VTGVPNTILLATVFTGCYALGGNLLVPIVLHVLWDVLALLVIPRVHAKSRRATEPGTEPPPAPPTPPDADLPMPRRAAPAD
jgi:hypothetical protein